MGFTEPFLMFVPTRFILGKGLIERELGKQAAACGSRAMLVSGRKHLKMGIVSKAEAALKKTGVSVVVFADVESDPSVETVERARDIAVGSDVDVIVGLGGGSANDAAKAVAIAARNPGGIWQYAATQRPGKEGIKDALPMICIPTTSGTGTEATKYAVITNRRTKVKDTLVSEHIFPRAAIIDVDLLVTMPRALTVATGLDAFCQAMESFLSARATPVTDALSTAAMSVIFRNLPKACDAPGDEDARMQMAVGSLLAGAAIAHNGCIAPHAFSHAIGGHCHVHHGTAVAAVTPVIMDYNLPCAVEKYCRLSAILGLERGVETDNEFAGKAVEKTRAFFKDIGAPTNLRDLGVSAKDVRPMAEDISGNISLQKNPRPMSLEDITNLLEGAL